MTNVSALPAGASETPFLLSQPALLQTPVLTALLTPPCPLSLILFIAQRCVCWCFLGPLSLPYRGEIEASGCCVGHGISSLEEGFTSQTSVGLYMVTLNQ